MYVNLLVCYLNYKMHGATLKMYIGLRAYYPLFLSDFHEASIFSTDFRKIF